MTYQKPRMSGSLQDPCSQHIANSYDLMIFDLDGTLMDTSEGILSAVKYTVDKCDLPKLTEEKIKTFIGPPIQDSFRKEYGLTVEKANEVAAVFRDRYKDCDLMKAVPYEDMVDTLKGLKDLGCKLGVATNKREDYALKLLDSFGLLSLFDAAFGSDMEGRLKKADIIELCIEKTSCHDRDRVALVGDTAGDLEGAKKAGIHFIAATYGFGFRPGESNMEADFVIGRPSDLLDI